MVLHLAFEQTTAGHGELPHFIFRGTEFHHGDTFYLHTSQSPSAGALGDPSLLLLLIDPWRAARTQLFGFPCVRLRPDSSEQVAVGKGNCILQLCQILSVSLGGSWTLSLSHSFV